MVYKYFLTNTKLLHVNHNPAEKTKKSDEMSVKKKDDGRVDLVVSYTAC